MEKGFFLYQLPGSSEIHGLKGQWSKIDTLGSVKEGIVVTAFAKDHIWNMIHGESISTAILNNWYHQGFERAVIDRSLYLDLVKEAVEFCQRIDGKVVVSRIKQVSLPESFDLRTFFERICKTYSHSFNYCAFVPEAGLWMGATPEKLVVGENNAFTLMSLAGSRESGSSQEWTEKEYQEQMFVTNAIVDRLKTNEVKHVVGERKTIVAGNVEHLQTEIQVSDFDATRLADVLHPTPAVCGIPFEESLAFIRTKEPHDRSLYAGIIGFINKEQSQLYVNLRCASFDHKKMSLFVGGGITSSSIPEKEWDETEFKSKTLLSIIEKM